MKTGVRDPAQKFGIGSYYINPYSKGEMLAKVKKKVCADEKIRRRSRMNQKTTKNYRMLSKDKMKKAGSSLPYISIKYVISWFLLKANIEPPGELKLCAYLRLNLGSKEIAGHEHYYQKR